MQITPTIKQVLLSISGRSKKYGKFWLSRHEYEKFWTTPDKLRLIIRKLKLEWYITFECYEPNPSFKANPIRAVYRATNKLLEFVKWLWKSISDMNEKIVGWCKNQNPIQTLRNYWIEVFNWGRLWEKRSKVTVNARNWSITNWKTWEKWNLFNYIRDTLWVSTHEFFINNI